MAKKKPMAFFARPFDKPKQKPQEEYRAILQYSDDDGVITQNIEQKWSTWFTESRDERMQWMMNAAYTRCQQWSVIHRTRDTLVELPVPEGRMHVTVDRIGPWKSHQVADMVAAMPVPTVDPDPSAANPTVAARDGARLLEYFFDTWEFPEQYITLCGHLVDFGNSYVFVNYVREHTERRTLAIDNLTGEYAVDENGEVIGTTEMVDDIVFDVLDPYRVAVPLDPYPLDKKDWVIIRTLRPLHYFRKYKNGDQVLPETNSSRDQWQLSSLNKMMEMGDGIPLYAHEDVYMQRPCRENKKGLVVIRAGNIVLEKSEWPFARLSTYPLEHFHLAKAPGEFYARSTVEAMIPIQTYINTLWSIIAENADTMAHLKWLIPDQGEVEAEPDNLAGEALRYIYPFKPEISDLKPLPQYITESLQMADMAMQDVQNKHGASFGTSVSGVRSEAHAAALMQQDAKPLTVLDNLMGVQFERLFTKVLILAAEKLGTDRTLQYTDRTGRQITIGDFQASVLGDKPRVKVRMANAHLRDRNMAKNDIMAFAQAGFITDAAGRPSPMKVMKALEYAFPDSILAEWKLHSDRAYAENDMLLNGQVVHAYPQQNHAVHLECHDELTNSPQYMAFLDEAKVVFKPDGSIGGVDKSSDKYPIIMNVIAHVAETQQLYQAALAMLMPKQQPEEQGKPKEQQQGNGNASAANANGNAAKE